MNYNFIGNKIDETTRKYFFKKLPIIAYGADSLTKVGKNDYVAVWKSTEPGGRFELPYDQNVWYLAVGGGGAGGTAINATYGQGGGGGAGGFVEQNPQKFLEGSYSIQVGRGGNPVATTTTKVGENGTDSILTGPDSSEIAHAYGGGGGGSQSVGSAGASGGGGSRSSSAGQNGGVGVTDQGYAGGRSVTAKYAAGGGGASGAGSNGTSALKGAGGKGKSSTISGTDTYYAGGGGGGFATGSLWPNGTQYTEDEEGAVLSENFGGGGNGSGNNTEQAATAGVDGLGGGGGGGGRVKPGARGGNGVVIVRFLNPPSIPILKECPFDVSYGTLSGLSSEYFETGSPIVPEISVYNSKGKLLTENTDWQKILENNTWAGTASLSVVGIGSYYGQMHTNFKIIEPIQ